MTTLEHCACGFDRARNDHVIQIAGQPVLIPPGYRSRLRACRGCRQLYAVTEAEDKQLPELGQVLERTPRGLVYRGALSNAAATLATFHAERFYLQVLDDGVYVHVEDDHYSGPDMKHQPFASELETVAGMGLRDISASTATPLRTAFWIEMLDGGEQLYVSSVRINAEEQLATQALVPAAVFELPDSFSHVILPVMRPGDVMRVGFANRGEAPARFWFWLGEPRALGELFGDPALRVRCPQCAATVGERCSTSNGWGHHLPRHEAYEARKAAAVVSREGG